MEILALVSIRNSGNVFVIGVPMVIRDVVIVLASKEVVLMELIFTTELINILGV